jgi:hypothetical protein
MKPCNMNKKLWPWMLGLLFLIQIAAALPYCGDQATIPSNCTYFTADVICPLDYNYTIINTTDGSGNIVGVGNLTPIVDNIYAFNFTQPMGTYVVLLCNRATREVYVVPEGGDNMFWVIILLPIILSFLLLGGATILDKEKYLFLRWVIFLFSPAPFILSISFASGAVTLFYGANADILRGLELMYWVVGTILFLLVGYFLWELAKEQVAKWQKKRTQRFSR